MKDSDLIVWMEQSIEEITKMNMISNIEENVRKENSRRTLSPHEIRQEIFWILSIIIGSAAAGAGLLALIINVGKGV